MVLTATTAKKDYGLQKCTFYLVHKFTVAVRPVSLETVISCL